MLCPYCGADVGDELKACDRCDARLKREAEKARQVEEYEDRAMEAPEEELIDKDLPYAGFWLRFFAWLFDASFVTAIAYALMLLLSVVVGHHIERSFDQLVPDVVERFVDAEAMGAEGENRLSQLLALGQYGLYGVFCALTVVFLGLLLRSLVGLFYYPRMEAAHHSGTFGKQVFGLQVTNPYGKPAGLWRTVLRYMGKQVWLLSFVVGFFLLFVSVVLGAHRVGPRGVALFVLFVFACGFAQVYGYIKAAFDPQKRALHDSFAGSLVIKRDEFNTDQLILRSLGVTAIWYLVGLFVGDGLMYVSSAFYMGFGNRAKAEIARINFSMSQMDYARRFENAGGPGGQTGGGGGYTSGHTPSFTESLKLPEPKIGALDRFIPDFKEEQRSVQEITRPMPSEFGNETRVRGLIARLESRVWFERLDAVRKLGRVGRGAHASVPGLIGRCKDENAEVRSVVAEALGQIAPERPEVQVALRGLLSDQDATVRKAAYEALKRAAGPGA